MRECIFWKQCLWYNIPLASCHCLSQTDINIIKPGPVCQRDVKFAIQIGPDWPQIGQIWDFQIKFRTFWRTAVTCTQRDMTSEKWHVHNKIWRQISDVYTTIYDVRQVTWPLCRWNLLSLIDTANTTRTHYCVWEREREDTGHMFNWSTNYPHPVNSPLTPDQPSSVTMTTELPVADWIDVWCLPILSTSLTPPSSSSPLGVFYFLNLSVIEFSRLVFRMSF